MEQNRGAAFPVARSGNTNSSWHAVNTKVQASQNDDPKLNLYKPAAIADYRCKVSIEKHIRIPLAMSIPRQSPEVDGYFAPAGCENDGRPWARRSGEPRGMAAVLESRPISGTQITHTGRWGDRTSPGSRTTPGRPRDRTEWNRAPLAEMEHTGFTSSCRRILMSASLR
jgi:hypothetical protein